MFSFLFLHKRDLTIINSVRVMLPAPLRYVALSKGGNHVFPPIERERVSSKLMVIFKDIKMCRSSFRADVIDAL